MESMNEKISNTYYDRCRGMFQEENMEVAMEALPCLPEAYPTFNDFFVLKIDRSQRPIRKEPHLCIAPVDGKVLVLWVERAALYPYRVRWAGTPASGKAFKR
jgi:hypothetical protein